MSGKPSPQGTMELLKLLEQVDPMLVEVEAAGAQVRALRLAQEWLSAAQDKLCETTREIGKLIEGMDCSSICNYGFESRMGWLLLEMRRQILAKVDARQPMVTL